MSQQEESYFENATVNLEINNIEYYQWNNATESDILESIENHESFHINIINQYCICSDIYYINYIIILHKII